MPPETFTSPAPPTPPTPPTPPVDWAAEAARQSKEYADAVNKRVADKLAQKKRDLDARTAEESETPSAAAKTLVDQGGVSVVEQDGRTIIKKDGKTIVDVPSKSRDRSSRSGQSNDIDHGVAIVFIVSLFLFLIIKAIMGPVHARRLAKLPGGGPGLSAEDSATLQKIHRTLGQMERRVEALETILADPRRTAAFTTVTRPSTAPNNPSTSYESKV